MGLNGKNNISCRQIRAARALLDWSQDELAEASGLSIATIRKIEAGSISPRDKTMGGIVTALEEANIEFSDMTGVRLKNQNVEVIEGEDCYLRLQDEIYHSMKKRGGEILFMNADSNRINEMEMDSHLRIRKAGIKYRVLMQEGNTYLPFPLNEFRWVPEKHFHYNLIIIYQNNVAICVYDKTASKDMDRIYIIHSEPLADSLKGMFEFMWENCRKPALTTAPKVYE